MTPFEVRATLIEHGYIPVAVVGKRPHVNGWQNMTGATAEDLKWCPGTNTGANTRTTPAIDIDITFAEAADAVEELLQAWFDGQGVVMTRTGQAPKRALLFRTSQPFKKLIAKFKDAGGHEHRIEVLGDGQQIVVDGIHPDTGKPYTWHGGTPMEVPRADLPELTEEAAREVLQLASDLLKEQFGFEDVPDPQNCGTGDGDDPQICASPPVDVEAELAAMKHGNINATVTRVIPSLLAKAEHPADVLERIVTRVMEVGEPDWNEDEEVRLTRKRILCAYNHVLLRDYHPSLGIPSWLPGEFHQQWQARLDEGSTPCMHFSRGGFCPKGRANSKDAEPLKHGTIEGADVVRLDGEPYKEKPERKIRFKLLKFSELRPGPEQPYLIDELFPVEGIAVVWGPPKCFKSFWCLDAMFHVAQGAEYRDRYVNQGSVVYCAFEGGHGYKKRIEALRRHYELADDAEPPLYVMPVNVNLILDHKELVSDLGLQLDGVKPAVVVLDTLNRSLVGSESKDEDMGRYIRAAEAIRDHFKCLVIIAHHCGYDTTRPRGHSSLPAAVDAQLAVARAEEGITVTVEFMRDGPEDIQIASTVEPIEVGEDMNGNTLTSLVVVPNDVRVAGVQKYPRGLQLFMEAVTYALLEHGQEMQIEPGMLPVTAVSQTRVRDRFYEIYADAEEDPVKRGNKLRQAFNRALRDANTKRTIYVRTIEGLGPVIWLPSA